MSVRTRGKDSKMRKTCRKKKTYSDEFHAHYAAEYWVHCGAKQQYPYQCPVCGAFHLTSKADYTASPDTQSQTGSA